jgi:hypothetical protein
MSHRWGKKVSMYMETSHGSSGSSEARLVVRMGIVLGLLAFILAAGCGKGQPPHEKALEIPFQDVTVDPGAVSKVAALVSPSHPADQEHLSPELQYLFTYLATTAVADLVATPAHSQGEWEIEKVFILDDCVAVQLSEGHYLETLLFVQYSQGWRLAARIRPQDHM